MTILLLFFFAPLRTHLKNFIKVLCAMFSLLGFISYILVWTVVENISYSYGGCVFRLWQLWGELRLVVILYGLRLGLGVVLMVGATWY